jgi:ligand-binding sensor domain-containing protein/two-component sensor histidine kinase
MQYIKLTSLLVVAMLTQICSAGQIKRPLTIKRCPVKAIGIDQGLLHTETNSIVTDSLGFTWVSTRMGLQRYNGYVLKKVTPVIGKDTVFINGPTFLFGFRDGTIWISYKMGILEFSPFTNAFKKIVSITAAENSFFSTVPLMQTADGIWCMQENKGIVIYRDGGFHPEKNDSDCIHSVNAAIRSQDMLTRKIVSTNKSFIFIRLNAMKVLQIDWQTHRYNYLDDFEGDLMGLGCTADKLFYQTNTSLYSFTIAPHKLIRKIPLKKFYNDNLTLGCIAPTHQNNSLLIAFNGRLYEFDTAFQLRGELTTLNKDPLGQSTFKHQIYFDKRERFWLLTNNDIEIVLNREVPFEHFNYPLAKTNSTRYIYYDNKSNLVLAGCININDEFNGGIRLFDTLSNALWQQPLVTDQLGGINAIERLSNDQYLVVTYDHHGWYLLDLAKRKLSPFILSVDAQTRADLYATQWINNLQRIDDTTLYVASPINIFRCVLRKNKLIEAERVLPFNSTSSNAVNCFIYTTDGILWVGTNSGLIYRFKNNHQLENVRINESYNIRCFTMDSLKNVWVGTDKGVYVFSEQGKFLKTINQQSGLLNDYIYAILPVGKTASVFASNNQGLSFISLNGIIKNYTKEFGLQSNEFNTECAVKTRSGKLYFGGVNGINAFYPEALSEPDDTPMLNIVRLVVNDSLFNSSSGSWIGDTLLLKYSQNHLQIDLAALGLFNADEYTYSYRLSNFEKAWQTTHQPTGIRYTLSPGTYLLEVKCSPILAPETVFYKRLVIILQPPWWQTWWFLSLASLAVVAVISTVIWQYNRRKFARKLGELQLQQEIQHERERISRDLHDNLGAYAAAISANVAKIEGNRGSNEAVIELQSNSQAIVTQLNDTIWALNREAISLTSVSDRFKIFLQKISPSYQQVNISVNESIEKDISLSPINALHLFRIMQEAVNNSARHSDCRHITISIESGSRWYVAIADDGVGITGEKGKSNGNGIRNMKLRAAEAEWDIKWEDNIPHGMIVRINPKPTGVL